MKTRNESFFLERQIKAAKAGRLIASCLSYQATLYRPKSGYPQFHVFAYIQDKSVNERATSVLYHRATRGGCRPSSYAAGRLTWSEIESCRSLAAWLEAHLDRIQRPEAAAAWIACVKLTQGGTLRERESAIAHLRLQERPMLLSDAVDA